MPLSPILRLRDQIHRRDRSRRLKALVDARKFLRELKLVAQTDEPHFPSLFGAAQGKPAAPSKSGFGRWPAHAWWWGGALSDEPWLLAAKLLRGKTILVHESLWPSLDAYIRPLFLQIRRGLLKLSALAQRILDTLHQEGPTRTDVLRGLLGQSSKAQGRAFHVAKHQVESLGLVIGDAVREADRHEHVDRLSLWTQKFPRRLEKKIAPYQGLSDFFQAVLQAAVFVPESEFTKWWGWPKEDVARSMEILVSGGAALMVAIDGKNGYTTPERMHQAFKR